METGKKRLQFIETLNSISNNFISMKAENAEEGILNTLEMVCSYSRVERGYLFLFNEDRERMELVYEWCAPGVQAHRGVLEGFAVMDLPDFMKSLYSNQVIKVNASQLPQDDANRAMNEILAMLSIKSFVNIPIFVADRLLGYIGFDATLQEKVWTEENIYAFTFVGQTIGNLLERIKVEQQLKDAVATKDKFFSILAHDLRNPFIGIVEGTKILQEELVENDDPFLAKISGGIHLSARRMQKLLEELLTLSRTVNGTFPFNPVPLDLYSLVAETVELVHWNCVRKEITVKVDLPDNIRITADRDMLQTVLRNLISNAVKFTERSGEIRISARQSSDGWELRVCDTGCGMEQEKIARLFHIGEKNITSPGTEGEKGSGLGLVLAQEFVARHGGTIRVESEPGKGSCFFVVLPAAKQRG